ncbi:MAG: hypothetical protein ABIJ00_02945 [Candidatus Eisenbacteria bacterium]
MTRRRTYLIALVIFAVTFGYFLSYSRYGLAYDEGYLLDGVEKIMEGQVIYRDFHHTYAPGRFYLVAAAFEVFGKNILVERVLFALLQAVKCGLAFLIVRAIVRSGFAYLAPVLIMIAPGPWHKVFFSSLGFLAAYAVMRSIHRGLKYIVLGGAIVGLCALFRQDVAGVAVIGGVAGMLLRQLDRREGFSVLVSRLACLLAGLAIVIVPVVLYFHAQGALGPMVHKITRDGMMDNMTNRIPYPGLAARAGVDSQYLGYVLPVRLLFYVPFVAYVLAAVLIIKNFVTPGSGRRLTDLVVVTIVSVLAFNQSVWRSDIGHLLQTMQYVYLLVPIILGSVYSFLTSRVVRGPGRRWVLKGGLVLAGPVLLFWAVYGCTMGSTDSRAAARFAREGISIGDTEYTGSVLLRIGNDTNLDLERAPVYVRQAEAGFFTALKSYLDAHTSPGEYVLAVPQLQMIYFLFDRKNPTRYAHYRRALEPAEEDRYIEDIESHGTNYILLTEPFEGARLGQTKEAFSQYGARVREWILENYIEVDRIGSVKILRRRT